MLQNAPMEKNWHGLQTVVSADVIVCGLSIVTQRVIILSDNHNTWISWFPWLHFCGYRIWFLQGQWEKVKKMTVLGLLC